MAYNYENDPEILAVAERIGKMGKDRIYYSFLNESDSVELSLYDFHEVGMKNPGMFSQEFPVAKTPRQNVINFIAEFMDIFNRSRSYDFSAPPEDVGLMAAELIQELFNAFSVKLQELSDGDIDKVIKWVQVWTGMTSEIIKDIYEDFSSANNAFGKPENTFFLYTGLMAQIDECYESFIENLKYGPFVSASKIILYNYWGEEHSYIVGKIRLDVAKNKEELEMTDLYYNKVRFARDVRKFLTSSMDSVISTDMSSAHDFSNDLRNLIQDQFSEYTKNLRRQQIVVRDSILFAVDFWYTTTGNILVREINNQLERVRLSTYEPGDKVHPNVFRTTITGKRKIEMLQILQNTSLNYLKNICDDYSNKLKHGELIYEWAGEIDALHIDYVKLWKAIDGKYISGIGADVLEDAIKCGDLSPVQAHIINSEKNGGAIITLAQIIGKRVRSWCVYASKSVHDTTGKPHTVESLIKFKPSSEASLEMIDIFNSCMPKDITSSRKKK